MGLDYICRLECLGQNKDIVCLTVPPASLKYPSADKKKNEELFLSGDVYFLIFNWLFKTSSLKN